MNTPLQQPFTVRIVCTDVDHFNVLIELTILFLVAPGAVVNSTLLKCMTNVVSLFEIRSEL